MAYLEILFYMTGFCGMLPFIYRCLVIFNDMNKLRRQLSLQGGHEMFFKISLDIVTVMIICSVSYGTGLMLYEFSNKVRISDAV